jgi:peptidoglycan biosynthesis protein MviN/MurJ (putative lipid II flippase)
VTVAGWTLVSRITGVLRVVVIGPVLGATYFANAFQTSYMLPHLVFTLIAGPVLGMVLVPSVVRAVGAGGETRAREILAGVSGWLLTIAVMVSVVLMIASPAVAWTLNFGIPDPASRARGLWLTTLVILLVAPQGVLYALVHLGTAAQQAKGRFALAAGGHVVESLILIPTVIFVGWYYGTGLDIKQVPVALVVVLGAASTMGVASHAALQLAGAARVGLLIWPSMRWRQDPEVRAITKRLIRSVGVAAWPAAAMYVLLALAGTVRGGVFVVQLTHTIFFSLAFVSARAVSMAVLPGLARAAHSDDAAIFGVQWRQALSYAMIASLPLLVLLAVNAGPAAHLLTTGQLRHAALIGPLTICMAIAAVAQLVSGLHDLGRQALFARLDDRTPRRASEVAFGVIVILAAASSLLPADGSRLVWLVVANLISELVAAGIVLIRLRRAIRPELFVEPRPLAAAVVATCAIVPLAGAVWWTQQIQANGRLANMTLLALGGAIALGVYVVVLRAVSRRISAAPKATYVVGNTGPG